MRSSVERLPFFVSAIALAFFLGYGVRFFGWVPDPFIERAVRQGHRLVNAPPPSFAVPRVYDRQGARTLDPEGVQPGVTLVASSWVDTGNRPEVRIIDPAGRTLHRWVLNPGDLFPEEANRRTEWGKVVDRGVHGFHLLPDGDLLVNVNYVGTVRLDACGQVIWTLAAGSHHSITAADDGSFWIPGVSPAGPARSPRFPDGYPGLDSPVYREFLLRVSADGQVLERLELLDLLYENGLERYLVKAPMRDGADLTHLNDVEPLSSSMAASYPLFEAGDLVVSLRFPELVFVVDPETRRVKWHASDPFIQQHDPDFTGGGQIGVFDNNRDGTERGTMLGGSRIVMLVPHRDSTRVLIPTTRSEPIYAELMGSWQRLENGNLLLTEATAGRVLEVTSAGRTVWDWVHEPYAEDRVPLVSGGTRRQLSPGEVASWTCSGSDTG